MVYQNKTISDDNNNNNNYIKWEKYKYMYK